MDAFWNLVRRIEKYKVSFTLSILANILLSVFTVVSIPAIVPFFQILFDRIPSLPVGGEIDAGIVTKMQAIIYSHDKDTALLIVCGLIIVIFLLKNIFRYLALYFVVPMRTGIVRDIRSELFERYMHLPMSYYSTHKTGDLISRLTLDVQEIEVSILKMIEVVFKSPLIILGSIAFMVYISPSLSLFVLVLLVFTTLVIGGISKTLKSNSIKAQEQLGNITSTVEESISGIRIIKGFNAEVEQKHRFDLENESYRSIIAKISNRQNLSSPLSEFLGICIVTALLWYGSKLVFAQALNPETFFAFIFAFYQVIEPAKNFSAAYYNIQKGMAAVERIEKLKALPSEQKLEVSEKLSFSKGIDIRNLSYQYPQDTKLVLDDVSLQIKKGEVVALVGTSGSGKTSLTDLIMGFYTVPPNTIFIDDDAVESIPIQQLRSLFGLVSQHAILFNDTIYNNIKFGSTNATREEVIQAAKVANAHDFILELQDGYDTIIGDKGMKISGGQRQRLTIARAVLYDPQVLILDEATSALDSESEKAVQDALENILHQRTTIVIAHRLSTVINADKIIVMDTGKIIAIGNHAELYQVSPLYQRFVDMQGV